MLLRQNFGKLKRGRFLFEWHIIFYMKQIEKTHVKVDGFSMGYYGLL